MIKIAPSILAADPLNLERDVRAAENAGCDWIHVDVMDAHFVPNLAFSPEVVRRLKEVTQLPIDVHLMMDQPETLLNAFIDAGASGITIHQEIGGHAAKLLDRIQERGCLAGIAVKPGTPAEAVIPFADRADMILVMTVEPGFGGQKLDEREIKKIRKLRDLKYEGLIQADGGIREDNIRILADNGLSVAVMGTALFRSPDMAAFVRRLHQISKGE